MSEPGGIQALWTLLSMQDLVWVRGLERAPGWLSRGGITGASGAQRGPCLASRSLSEFIKGLCCSQTQSSSRPTYQDCRKKLETSRLSRQRLCMEREAFLNYLLCRVGMFFQGQELRMLLETLSKEQEGLFCALKFRRQRPTLRLLA